MNAKPKKKAKTKPKPLTDQVTIDELRSKATVYMPLSMHRKLRALGHERFEKINNLVVQAIDMWLKAQQKSGKRRAA